MAVKLLVLEYHYLDCNQILLSPIKMAHLQKDIVMS